RSRFGRWGGKTRPCSEVLNAGEGAVQRGASGGGVGNVAQNIGLEGPRRVDAPHAANGLARAVSRIEIGRPEGAVGLDCSGRESLQRGWDVVSANILL